MRDKDAVQSTEVAAYYKEQGKSLYDGLVEIFETYGFYKESLQSLTLKGKDGSEKVASTLAVFRPNPPTEVADLRVATVEDYLISERTNMVD